MWRSIVNWFLGLFGSLITNTFKNQDVLDSFNDVLDLALPAVLDLANADLDGNGKRNLAFERIQGEAVMLGFKVSSHLIYLAIETAVAHLKANRK